MHESPLGTVENEQSTDPKEQNALWYSHKDSNHVAFSRGESELHYVLKARSSESRQMLKFVGFCLAYYECGIPVLAG